MGLTRHLFRLFSVFFKQTIQFLQQINVKNVKSGAGIQTHDLWNVSLLPKPLDQGSRPTLLILSMMTEDVTERKKGVGGIKDTCSLPFKTELNYIFA